MVSPRSSCRRSCCRQIHFRHRNCCHRNRCLNFRYRSRRLIRCLIYCHWSFYCQRNCRYRSLYLKFLKIYWNYFLMNP